MARNRRRKDRGDKAKGIVFMLLGFILIAGLAGGGYWLSQKRVKLDAVTGCPVTGPTAIHAILIDRSDPISPQQAQQVRLVIDGYVSRAKIGERFDLYVASGDTVNVLTPVASVCSPGRGDQANELYENPQMIQRQFEDKFVGVMKENLSRLLETATADSSPILESIKAAAVSSFGSVEPGQIPLQMTIVSDLVQHSQGNSHFRGETNFDDLSKRSAWRSLQANLKGASVNVLYLLRPVSVRSGQPIQNRGHQVFWEKALSASGASDVKFTSL
jgi:hypothetical protein